MARTGSRLDGWTALLLSSAALWSLGLVAAGFFVNAYSSTNAPGLTVIQLNGMKVLPILLIPFVGVVLVALALWHRRRLQKPGVGIFVWVIFGFMVVFVFLGALSIGPFVAPVALFLVVAIARVKSQSEVQKIATP